MSSAPHFVLHSLDPAGVEVVVAEDDLGVGVGVLAEALTDNLKGKKYYDLIIKTFSMSL